MKEESERAEMSSRVGRGQLHAQLAKTKWLHLSVVMADVDRMGSGSLMSD